MLAPDATATTGPLAIVPARAASLTPAIASAPGRLENGARVLEGVLDRGADLVERDPDDAVEVALAEREGVLAGLPHRDAVGEGADALELDAPVRLERARHRVRVLGLNAEDAHLGTELLHHRRHARREAAAADRDEDRRQVARRLMQDLEADRRLAGDDVEIVVGRNQDHAGLARDLLRVRRRDRVVVADELDRRTEPRDRAHLDRRRGARHHDPAPHAEAPGRECDALRVVARRGGDRAGGAIALAEAGHAIVGAADLEREDRRQVLALQEHRSLEATRERLHRIERRRLRQHLRDARVERALEHVVHHATPAACGRRRASRRKSEGLTRTLTRRRAARSARDRGSA
jgi:hypothetical protein